MSILVTAFSLLLWAEVPASRPATRPSVSGRLSPQSLAQVDRERAALAEKAVAPEVPYSFVRGVFHIHSRLSHDSRGTMPEIVAAAKATGTRIVGFSEHPRPQVDVVAENVKGWHDGVYFLAGTESSNTLHWPGWEGEADLRFVSHPEEVSAVDRQRYDGMEIYNTHSDAKDEPVRRLLAAMIGIAAGLTVIWYTAQFQALYFLQNALRIDDTAAQIIVGAGAIASLFWFVFFGWLSDRIGRKKPIIIGYALTIVLLFPLFHAMANLANPALSDAMARSPVVVTGSDCAYNPFAQSGQTTECGKVLDILSKRGVAYTKKQGDPASAPVVTIGGTVVDATAPEALEAGLKQAGYNLDKVAPPAGKLFGLILCIIGIGCLSGMTYGPVASWLVELFPARTRYTSMSIPYHIGTGYFGGFLPFISQYIVARTGDPFAGLWYTVGVVAVALVVAALFLPETSGKELD